MAGRVLVAAALTLVFFGVEAAAPARAAQRAARVSPVTPVRSRTPRRPVTITGVAGWPSGTVYFNVRAAPSLTSPIVATLRPGHVVRVIASVAGESVGGDDVWYLIGLGSRRAYVLSSGIAYVVAQAPWIGVANTNSEAGVSAIYSLAAPRSGAESDAAFAPGAQMMVLGIVHGSALEPGDDVWYKVSTGSYRPAYIYSAYLKLMRLGTGPVPLPLITATSALAVDLDTLRTLFARNATVPRAPASEVKMMTAAVALDHLRADQVITIPVGAPSVGMAVGGTTMGLVPGERLSLRDLLYGMLLPSGNDAAYAIAQAVAGSQEAFARMMNAKASEIGMADTHFVQGYGLDSPGQYSTARDLMLLARYDLLHYPLFDRIVATTSYAIGPGRTHQAYALYNRNQLLGTYPGMFGVKTGTTPDAGQNLVAAVARDGHRILAVVLGSANRYADGVALLNYAVAVDQRADPKL